MQSAEEEKPDRGPNKSQEHVPLGVPGIALGAKESYTDFRGHQVCGPPFYKLVERRSGQYHAQDEEIKPTAPF
jgi:hypothetical protein